VFDFRRREFIKMLGGAAAAVWPLAAAAQQPARLVRIGMLASLPLPPQQRFARKLQEYGYVAGRNLQLEQRFAEGKDDRYPALAAELIALPVDIVVTWGTPAAIAVKQATSTTPIVMAASGDPVSVGIVTNLARPGDNITGFAAQNVELEGKRLELLKDLIPQLARVGILANATNPFLEVLLKRLRSTAELLRVALELVEVRSVDEVPGALLRLDRAHPDGVLVSPDLLLVTRRDEIAAGLAKSRLPAVYPFREYAAAGGLIVHGANLAVLSERSADYVDRILKGARPGDLPVEQAAKFDLVVNLKTARALGLTIPPPLLLRADQVIE
jgi:putative ABC transport system substrate-binding protein